MKRARLAGAPALPFARNHSKLNAAALVAFAAIGLSVPANARAAIDLFTNSGGTGIWEDINNWTGVVPTTGDSAFIDSGNVVSSNDPANVCNELQVGVGPNSYGANGNPGGTGILNILSGSTITANGNLVVGQSQDPNVDSSGTINIESGATLNIKGGNSLMGFFGQSITNATIATINVNGGAYNWNAGNNNATLWVGGDSLTNHRGRAVFNMTSGTASGAAIRVGDFGVGTFNLSGGTFSSNFYMAVGLGNNPNEGNGTVNVSGGVMNLAQLTLNESKLNECVFTQSGGTVNVGGNGQIDGYNFRIGLSANGKGTYNMTAGALNVAGNDLWVGAGKEGEMNISGASVVTVNYIPVPNRPSNYGFALGGRNGGIANVNQNSGTVTILNTSLLGIFFKQSDSGTSNYNLSGGTLTLGGISSDNGTTAKTFNFNGGTLIAGQDMTVPNPARSANPTNFFTTISAGGANINTAAFAVTWAKPLSGVGNLTKSGTGSLNLTAANTYGGSTTVNAGTLVIDTAGTLGSGAGTVTVNAGATLKMGTALAASPVIPSLVVAGTAAVPTATIDVTTKGFVLDYSGAIGTLLTDTLARVKAGKGAADVNGVYPYNAAGITSSTIATDNAAVGFNKYAIGAINNADLTAFGLTAYTTFGGAATVDSDAVLVHYTYNGDANLDGKIDAVDFDLLNRGYAGTIANVGWLSGDFTGDGLINADDYAVIDFGFLKQGAALGLGEPVSVPEPASLGLITLAAAALMKRARRER